MINRAAIDKIHAYTEIGSDEGARLLTGGEIATDGDLAKGFFYRPTVFGDVDAQMRIAQEEIFGPTTALIRVRDFDEALRVANGISYGLSSSIFTRDVNKAFRAMRDLQAGITYVNAGTTGAEVHLPFGGTKDTGNGHREAGQAALDVFTEWKSIYVDYSGRLQRAQIDNRSDAYASSCGSSRAEALEATRDAVFAAGAGRIGNYERCSWYTAGTGTFLAGEGAEPALGRVGCEERVDELRAETVVPAELAAAVVAALRAAHPYEEVAFELYPLVETASEGAPLHRRRLAGQPRPGGVRLRPRGRRRHRARRPRCAHRCRDEQRRRVPRPPRGPRAGARARRVPSSRSSPTPSCS